MRHCRDCTVSSTLESDGWTLRDVGSSNGTFVNGAQAERHLLVDGDRIAAGSNLLLFARDASALARTVAFDEDAPLTPTRRVALQDVVYFGSSAASAALHPGTEGLKALLAISNAIHAVRDESQLQVKLLDLLFEALPVAGGVILRPGANGELDIQAVRPVASPSLVRINSAVVSRVMGEGVGILFTPTPGKTPDEEQSCPAGSRVPSVVA